MTEKEALLFFTPNNEESIIDTYESFIFEYKQFFLTKYPIQKVFSAKTIKMMQMHEAFIYLGGKIENNSLEEIDITNTNESISKHYNEYQRIKSRIKHKISVSNNAFELKHYSEQLIKLEVLYSNTWPDLGIQLENPPLISKEPDPMSIIEAIKEFNLMNGTTFDDLKIENLKIIPKLLIQEAQRLTSYRKL